jgi:hypothetical protein
MIGLIMKNQYFGDVNDYLKYGLLRGFTGIGLRIGVCWMLTPDDQRSDGSKIKYLSKHEQWRLYDPILFDHLSQSIKKQTRHVREAQKPALLYDALFFNALVPDNEQLRRIWLTKALVKLKRADLLFFDPDNGIEVKSKPWGRTGSCKYLYWDEIKRAWSQDFSLLIFQHFPRQNHERYALHLASQLREQICNADVIPLITSNVVYLLARQPRHIVQVDAALTAISTNWKGLIRT